MENRRGNIIRLRRIVLFRSLKTRQTLGDGPSGFQHSDGPQWRISEQGPGKALKLKVRVPEGTAFYPTLPTGSLW